VIKLQKNLEQIYEKSFEVLEKKIDEQSQEIEMLREMVKTRDNEIQRLKKELEVFNFISMNLNYKHRDTHRERERNRTGERKKMTGTKIRSY
jgi:hypothetical protein